MAKRKVEVTAVACPRIEDMKPPPPGKFKCTMCGKLKDEQYKAPGLPVAWTMCQDCNARRFLTETKYTNPLGPTASV